MKKYMFFILIFISTTVHAQFQGATFNNVMNLGEYETLEFVPGTNMSKEEKAADDLVGNLFGKVGLNTKTNEHSLITLSVFMDKPGQVWKFSKVGEGEFVISNENYEQVLAIEGASKNEKAKIVPEEYKQGAAHQIFIIRRDTVDYRYGFYLVSKHSGLALQVDKEKKEIYQAKLNEGNAFQVWVMALRKTFVNSGSGKFITPDKSTIFFSGGSVKPTTDGKSVYNNWDFINHPTASFIFYVMNSFSRKFLSVPKDENNNLVLGEGIQQISYYKTGQLLFHFRTLKGTNDYMFYCYPGTETSFTVDGDVFKTVPSDTTQQLQHWKLGKANFSIF